MPTHTYQFETAAAQETVWKFVSRVTNWAHHVPGFQRAVEHSPHHSTWWLKGAIGPFEKVLELDVYVEERVEPYRIRFTMKSPTYPLHGGGSFETAPMETGSTSVQLTMEMTSAPPAGPVINMFINARLPSDLKQIGQGLVSSLAAWASRQ